MIDWKKIKKIDAHIHLMPPDVIAANKEYGGNFIDFGDVRDYLEIMDKYNIESAFIMPFNDSCMLSILFGTEIKKIYVGVFLCKYLVLYFF